MIKPITMPKEVLAICDGCGMSGLAEKMDRKVCKKCTKLEILERKVIELESTLQILSRKVGEMDQKPTYAGAVRHRQESNEEVKMVVMRQGSSTEYASVEVENMRTKKKRDIIKFVGEERDSLGKEMKVLVVGDSNVRNVGRNLALQSNRFTAVCCPGAKIEELNDAIERADEEADTCIIQIGTNNILVDEKEVILEKFKALMEETMKKRKRVLVAGILPRKLPRKMEIKRNEINSQLRKICKEVSIEFIEIEFNAFYDGYLTRDGLHLNWRGADKVARTMFDKIKCTCKCCLN